MIRYAFIPLLVATVFLAAPARAETVLNIPGIQGDVALSGHAHEIEISSMQFGGGQVVPKSGPKPCAAPSSKTQLSAIVLTKLSDIASPKLLMAAAQGTSFPQVTITIVGGSPLFADIDQYQLSDVFISSFTVSNGGQPQSSESLSLTFKSVQFTHNDPSAGPSSATWSTCGG
jgi:type VI protein secretion system component Hcp